MSPTLTMRSWRHWKDRWESWRPKGRSTPHRRFVLQKLAPRAANQPFPLVSTIANVGNQPWHSGTDEEIMAFIDSATETNQEPGLDKGGIEEVWVDTGWFAGIFPGGGPWPSEVAKKARPWRCGL